jgi:hypothetical protein
MNNYMPQHQAVSSQANLRFLQVKPQSGGRRQNGQPVEFGQPLFIIG